MTTKNQKVQRTEQVGAALSTIDDAKAKSMQHALAEEVIRRERAAEAEAEATASFRAIRDDKPGSVRAVASAALTLAAVASPKLTAQMKALASTEMAAGFSAPDAVRSALKLVTGDAADVLNHLVAKAEKSSRDHEDAVAAASAEMARAQDHRRACELSVQKLLKEAELLVHTLAPRGSQARSMIKRIMTPRKKKTVETSVISIAAPVQTAPKTGAPAPATAA